jgi:hypothetical protein
MLPGERAVLEGLLAAVEPSLSIEIGIDRGGSLETISARSRSVHAFDLVRDAGVTPERFPNVTFHIGDSHELLPRVLEQLSAGGRNVDFVFVDGDHTAVGVRRDVEDLLASPAVRETVILVHDTLNERVRAGLEDVDYDSFGKVTLVDLDFVLGRALKENDVPSLWAGLGLIVTGLDTGTHAARPQLVAGPDVYGRVAAAEGSQLLNLERELAEQRESMRLMERSWSWRLTKPLRSLRRIVKG